jgi:hypothetical protein
LDLQAFADQGLNRRVDYSKDLVVHTDMSPPNLSPMYQNALPGIDVRQTGASAMFTLLGFHQTLNLAFTPVESASSGTEHFSPIKLTILERKDYEDTAGGFQKHIRGNIW